MPTMFDKKFLAEEEKLNQKIGVWVREEQKIYNHNKGYLGNKTMVEDKSKMYELATRAPKGGHLHIHFNSCLEPDFLLKRAQDKEVNRWMYISLPEQRGALTKENCRDVRKIKFHFMTSVQHQRQIGKDQQLLIKDQPVNVLVSNVFGQDYGKLTSEKRRILEPRKIEEEEADLVKKGDEILEIEKKIAGKKSKRIVDKESKRLDKKRASLVAKRDKMVKDSKEAFEKKIKLDERMLFSEFLVEFEQKIGQDAMLWLQKKLVFSSDDINLIYPDKAGTVETCARQWSAFDNRTQMMAGLFNTEHVYRKYTSQLLETLQRENIQYAEMRPNFMSKNQVYGTQNPTKLKNNKEIMDMIIEEYETYQHKRKAMGKPQFGGLKVIYCTPRVFTKDEIEWALDECLEMKQTAKYRNYIAGFDIIGPENKPNPLSFFKEELQEFQRSCKTAKVECPFLFHAGESHRDPDGNLGVALELNARRIAHGYAIKGNRKVLQDCKSRGKSLCIECCPISNQILGLHPYAKDAVVYDLMKADIPCALASDNPTLFSSVLAHDFYQFMIGKEKFRLQDWRQLAQDSLLHAVWNSTQERDRVLSMWERAYVKFVTDVLKEIDEAEAESAGSDNSQRTTTSRVAMRDAPGARPTKQPIQGGDQNTVTSRSGPPATSGPTQRRPDGHALAPAPGKGSTQPQRRVTSSTTTTTSGAANGAAGRPAPRNATGSTSTTMAGSLKGTAAAMNTRQANGDASRAPGIPTSMARPTASSTHATNSQTSAAKSRPGLR